MASRDYVLQALSDAHLRAIGKVAAQWSSLEHLALDLISKITAIPVETVLVLVGTQGIKAWFEILQSLSGEHLLKKPWPLGTLYAEVQELQRRRNEIVHCNWQAQYLMTPGMGLAGMRPLPRPTSAHLARGSGISRNKRKPEVPVAFTASEMLRIATKIKSAERALYLWFRQWQKRQPLTLASALSPDFLRRHSA